MSCKEILVTGTSGVGKSTLVNGLIGKSVTRKDNHLRAESKYITSYKVNVKVSEKESLEIVVWDSPGLEDGPGTNGCLAELKEKCSNVDVVIYCIDLSVTRSYGLSAADIIPKDIGVIKKLTATFGSFWWKRSIFVMTRANVLESALKVKPNVDKRFNDRLQEWKERIQATLIATGVPEKVVYKIPVEPAGHPKKQRLPARENWLSAFRRLVLKSTTMSSTKEEIDLPHEQEFVVQESEGKLLKSKELVNEESFKFGDQFRTGLVTDHNHKCDSVPNAHDHQSHCKVVQAAQNNSQCQEELYDKVDGQTISPVAQSRKLRYEGSLATAHVSAACNPTLGSVAAISPQSICLDDQKTSYSISPNAEQGLKAMLGKHKLLADSKKIMEVLITGTSGVGKSTLVDSLVGTSVTKPLQPVGSMEMISSYRAKVKVSEKENGEGMEIVVWDSPGLEDGSGKESAYLNELKKRCSNTDVVIYCIDLSATRSYGLSAAEVAPKDLSAITKLTATFGSSLWMRSIFVMTRANVLESALSVKPDPDKRFSERLQEWKERIHFTLLATGVHKEVAYNIPVVPVGHPKKPQQPGRENWLGRLRHIIFSYATLPSLEGGINVPLRNPQDQSFIPLGHQSTCEDKSTRNSKGRRYCGVTTKSPELQASGLTTRACSARGHFGKAASFRAHKIGGIIVYLRKVGREKLL